MNDSLIIVMPAYNEEETLHAVLQEWYQIIEIHNGGGRSRLLVINDGSRDGTETILKRFSEDHPLFAHRTQPNGGHGAALWNGYRLALRMHADYIFQTDSDGQTSAADFQSFWRRREQADVILGRREHREDGRSRIFVSRVLSGLIRMIFHVYTPDANCPYRLMSRRALRDALGMVPRRYFLTNVLLSVAFEKQRKEVLLLPISFRKRQGGTNSIHIRNIMKVGIRSIYEFMMLERIYQRRHIGVD
ncbi:MAG: glycosyltransferase family 2 protein [Lachnospiraceae bacterium]|nr:glycosyltransferase family 2 protein [Lachnospiraceae bacterium]